MNMDRVRQARENFMNGCNCAQSVAAVYGPLFGISEQDAMRMSDGLGGGMGRMRLTCGAVSAMAMVAGLKYSTAVPGDLKNRQLIYEKVREMAAEFERRNGSVCCGELLGIKDPRKESAVPSPRTAEYYKKRPCPDYVADCAEIIERVLMDDID